MPSQVGEALVCQIRDGSEVDNEERVAVGDQRGQRYSEPHEAGGAQIDDEDAVLHAVTVGLEQSRNATTAVVLTDVVGDQPAARRFHEVQRVRRPT